MSNQSKIWDSFAKRLNKGSVSAQPIWLPYQTSGESLALRISKTTDGKRVCVDVLYDVQEGICVCGPFMAKPQSLYALQVLIDIVVWTWEEIEEEDKANEQTIC